MYEVSIEHGKISRSSRKIIPKRFCLQELQDEIPRGTDESSARQSQLSQMQEQASSYRQEEINLQHKNSLIVLLIEI